MQFKIDISILFRLLISFVVLLSTNSSRNWEEYHNKIASNLS